MPKRINSLKGIRLEKRKDIALLMVGGIAMLGGFLVVKSYANRSVNTTVPNTSYSTNELKIASNAVNLSYIMDLQSGLTYCFELKKKPDRQIYIEIDYKNNSISTTTIASDKNVCFISTQSIKEARVSLLSEGNLEPTRLNILK